MKNISSIEYTILIRKALFEKYHEVPMHFELLYHVIGLGRSDLDSELIRIEKLNPRLRILAPSHFAQLTQ